MRFKITLQSPVVSSGAYGQTADAYSDVLTTNAAIRTMKGREIHAAQRDSGKVPTEFRIRYRDNLRIIPNMRIKYGTRIYHIDSSSNVDERNKEVLIHATEFVDQT